MEKNISELLWVLCVLNVYPMVHLKTSSVEKHEYDTRVFLKNDVMWDPYSKCNKIIL